MAEFYWPQDIIPASQQWKIVDNAGVFQSPLSGANRTVSRPGLRVGCSLTVPALNGANRHRMMGLIASLVGRSHRIWVPDFSTKVRGSFPTSELLGSVATSWASSNAELSLYSDSGRLRMTRTGIVANRYAYATTTTTASAKYLFRAGMLSGYGSMSYALQIGTSAGASDIATSGTKTANGYQYATGTASGTTSYVSILDNIASRSVDNFQILDTPSFARCATVNGASQTGSGLLVSGLPVSTSGLLVAGDMVAVYTTTWEMKRITADLNSNSSGNGYMMFEPALRTSPANGAPIAIQRPMTKMMLSGPETSWDTEPGLFSSFTLEMIEDLT